MLRLYWRIAVADALPDRLTSLDVFRGLALAAMVIVAAPAGLSGSGAAFQSSMSNGWTAADLIAPCLAFIMGASITLSPRTNGPVRGIMRRAVVLYAIGVVLSIDPRLHVVTVLSTGALQRLAIGYLIAALLCRAMPRRGESARVQVALGSAALLLVASWAWVRFGPVPGGAAGGLATISHADVVRHRAEPGAAGLITLLSVAATTLAGVAAGVCVRGSRSVIDKVAGLIVLGGVAMAAGLGWDQRFPINAQTWTSSFVLLASGSAAILFACIYWIIDVRDRRRLIRPAVVLGRNGLTVFVLLVLVLKIAQAMSLSTALPPAVVAVAALGILYVPCELLYRREWSLRA